MPGLALEGFRVLDLTQHLCGPYATKLLADFGADVIKIERPASGDPARRLAPFLKNEPHPERSGIFAYLNTNKRSVTLDLGGVKGRDIFFELLAGVDLVVENFRPGVLEKLGIGFAEIHERCPTARADLDQQFRAMGALSGLGRVGAGALRDGRRDVLHGRRGA